MFSADKLPLGRDPDRSQRHRHSSVKLSWSQPMDPWTERQHTRMLPPILVLFSHIRLSIPIGLFLVDLPLKMLKELLPSSITATCLAHLNLIDSITLTILGEGYKLSRSTFWRLLHSPFLSLSDPNIRLSIWF